MAEKTDYTFIRSDRQLAEFCQRISESPWIGFDTEFVSENVYRPELCLLQIAAAGEFAIVDTLEVKGTEPFWQLIVSGDRETIVHAAREEFLFCFRECGEVPQQLFDVQLAAGFIGIDFPSSYGNLIGKLLGDSIDKGETRTDWRRRPLSHRQLNYALQDVVYLYPMYNSISQELDRLGRRGWYQDEIRRWAREMVLSETEPQWHRVPGISNLKRRALAIVRSLWSWRDSVAAERNRAPRRILPDDLMIELAKRGSADIKRLKAIRGFQSRVGVKRLEPIAEAIQAALDLPEDDLPRRLPRTRDTNLGLLGQFLTTALNIVCRDAQIAPTLVGTAKDVRQHAAWKLGLLELDQESLLASGWRAEIVGQVIDQVLAGQMAIRVEDVQSDLPLVLEAVRPPSTP